MSAIDNFGMILKELRKLRGLTQDDLASRTGRSLDAVSQWERGVNWPSFETLIRLSEALDVPVESFFEQNTAKRSGDRLKKEVEARLLLGDLTDGDLVVAVEQLRALANRR
ncbi:MULTISPECIES: helix-turn-helix transcriptional regulator [unclassified Mesorhizobium]|uniref:helix-turn-helix domain-containing protein n=1 Tax=unclassified Mesorhizobium TaxID=325217 RepID=UPI001092EE4F|nr:MULTISPECIES: helix-turn-helix transcriptional regulator [unclassified Mesorhizobium]TGQ27734.1 XRE family transcriptional regulator [Mesorhizobium sp. M4B.F.Ca.ET.214.01.1.1]TGQ54926.1 XRE family transcriptional regulator [Mesorhizobium sp. M4B.F.Ca.ET.211.01.1.1]TGU28325.1 XRE family transcriptional regulator [Mesorhizobium sp. M4B.F.Ca.ET.150.01.1.1]